MPIENDNTVVQVPLFYLERRMWASVTRHPLQFFNFFKEGCKNYLKICLEEVCNRFLLLLKI